MDIYKPTVHLHDVDSHPDSCCDEHDISIYVKVLVYRPLYRFIDQYGSEYVDKCHTEDCRYHL